WKLFARGDYVFLAQYDGLNILNVADPTNPTPVDFFGTGTAALDVAATENYAYVINGYVSGGLQILNTMAVEMPKQVARGVAGGGTARRVVLQGDVAYFTDVSAGLTIVNVADPTNPMILGRYRREGFYATGLAVKDQYAYITDGASPGTLSIIDATDPTRP